MSIPNQVTIRGDAAALKQAADALAGKILRPEVRAYAIPDDAAAYSEAIDNGAIATLHAAGFIICAPCTADPALAQGENAMPVPGIPLSDMMAAVLGPRA